MFAIKKLALAAAGTAMVAFGSTGEAQAISFSEPPDAGQTLGNARVLTGTPGTSITSISGRLGGAADLFQFYSPGGLFSATTVGQPGTLDDTQLFLFNSAGFGLLANDDASGTRRSTISTTLSAGLYFLGISSYDYDPVSRGPGVRLREIFPDPPYAELNGPTGFGGSRPLETWRGEIYGSGTYRIALSGAQVVGVPEPASVMGLLAFGALGAASFRQRKQSKQAVEVPVES